MSALYYTFDLKQVSSYLNKKHETQKQVTPELLQNWAEGECFPVQLKGGIYRIGQEVLPLVEKTRELILEQGLDIMQAKNILRGAFFEKERQKNEEEMREMMSFDPNLFDVIDSIENMFTGNIIALADTETSMKEYIKNNQHNSEEAIKRTVIHAESRLTQVMKQLQDTLNQIEIKTLTSTEKELQELQTLLNKTIEKHQNEMTCIKNSHEETIQQLNEKHQEELKEIGNEWQNSYEELLHAGFFKRLTLKKRWKKSQ